VTATDTRASNQQERPVPVVSTGTPPERFTSRNPDDFDVPTGREEVWRFTPQRPLRALFQPITPADTIARETEVPDGVSLTVVGRDHPLFGSVVTPADRIGVLAAAGVEQVLLISIPANASVADPIVIRSVGSPGLNYEHVIIDAGQFSSAMVVLDHVGDTTVAGAVETIVGDGAKLTLISVQDWDPAAIQVSAHGALVKRDGNYVHVSVNLGGKVVRITPTVTFGGPGAQAELYGLTFAQDGQHAETRLYVDHSVPHCTSNVVYKSVLQGDKARTVWIGDVRIRPAAIGTSTYELNRNLLLTDGARADSVPNLEIETGEIAGAGHASATGRFDELQLFYLQSRGIPEDEARRLVVRGFFDDILAHVPVTALRERLSAVIDARLGH
jgi:Fe-S cluster assembly protein SufD